MISVVPQWFIRAALTLFGLLLLWSSNLLSHLGQDWPILRTATTSASVVIIAGIVIFNGTGRFAIWRIIWRAIPKLNDALFPDICGVWIGTTRSNWTAIEKLRQSASSGERIDLDDLFDLQLKEGQIALQIRANLFGIHIKSVQSDTNSTSKSMATSLRRELEHEGYTLSYTYKQETPEPSATDESEHVGAAILNFDCNHLGKATGNYWTRRFWKDGRNTAGRLQLNRISRDTNWTNEALAAQLITKGSQ